MRRSLVALVAAVLLIAPAVASAERCRRIENPYEGTRYDGRDLRRIRAQNVTCEKAREVVRKAHHKAFFVPSENYTWHAWRVHIDSGDTYHYRARRGDARISWVF
jgi:hypothetical protein